MRPLASPEGDGWAGRTVRGLPEAGRSPIAGAQIQVEFRGDEGWTFIQRDEFSADLARELHRLSHWSSEHGWTAQAVPKLRVIVSPEYTISRSLVPAWEGRCGEMEFPASRVKARKAAVAHELVHVFFPNANRLLAEGLAIHLQDAVGGNPAFPNFGEPLHRQARRVMLKMVPGGAERFDEIHLADLDAIATPNPLVLRVGQDFYGEEPRGQGHVYPLAGSFTRFLIEAYGIQKFRQLYLEAPFVPGAVNAGSSQRWMEVYGMSIAKLDREWKARLRNTEEVSIATS